MLDGIIEGLFIAFILSIFNFDDRFIEGLQPILPFEVNKGTYYLTFAILGLVYYIF